MFAPKPERIHSTNIHVCKFENLWLQYYEFDYVLQILVSLDGCSCLFMIVT